MKFGRIVLQVNTYRLTESDFSDMTSYFKDGGHDVISGPPAAQLPST